MWTTLGLMEALHQSAITYYLNDYWEEEADPRTKHLPLMRGGPWTLFSIIFAYLYFIKKLGPELMKTREPFQLKKLLIFYNGLNVLMNGWFFIECLYCLNYGLEIFNFKFPNKTDLSYRTLRCCTIGYIYFLSKLIDLFDTVFFVLRKKYNQITTLHVYHHSIVPILAWLAIKLLPTAGPPGLFPLLNSLVHVVMYTYYALAALGPKWQSCLWWKKYITLIQLTQFIFLTIHGSLFLIYQTGYPPFLVGLGESIVCMKLKWLYET